MKSIIAQELERIGALAPEPFEVTFADGETFRSRPGTPAFSLRFNSRAVEWGIAAFGHIGMCEAYFDGDLDIDGDLRAALRAGMHSVNGSKNVLVNGRNHLHELRYSNASPAQAKENARAHYGLGTEFYRLWLDDR
jgi:cyclopropane-fatty-acyl-phospholipid synthase